MIMLKTVNKSSTKVAGSLMDILSANVRRILRQQKIPAIEVARRMKTSRQYIYMIRAGLGNITLESLEKLAEALEVTPGELLRKVTTKVDLEKPPLPPFLKKQYGLDEDEKDESLTAVSRN